MIPGADAMRGAVRKRMDGLQPQSSICLHASAARRSDGAGPVAAPYWPDHGTTCGKRDRALPQAESSLRTMSAPALSALSFPFATSRGSGAMPQLVHG